MAQIFKEKEELEQYFDNLGVEYRYSCYSDKNPEGELLCLDLITNGCDLGCHLLGEFMHLIRNDFKKAYTVFEFACKEYKYGKSCNQLGTFTFQGKGIKKPDLKKAAEYFDSSCENNSPEGCFHFGQMVSGRDPQMIKAGIKPDYVKSIKAFEKGCQLGNPDSCFSVSAAYMFGEIGVEKDDVKAFNFAKKACEEFNHFESCNNLGIMYSKGIGTKKDPAAFKAIQRKLDDYLDQVDKKRSLDMGRGST